MSFLKETWESNESGLWLGLVRILVGIVLLHAGLTKILGSQPFDAGKYIGFFAQNNPFGWYKSFLEGVIIPQAGIFNYLVPWGETILGVMFILGLLTNFATIGALVMFANYFLAAGHINPSAFYLNAILTLLQPILFFGCAGKALSIDQYISKRARIAGCWTHSCSASGGIKPVHG